MSCHICNSKDNEKCADHIHIDDFKSVCPLYNKEDECVASYNYDGKFTERDCKSKPLQCNKEDEDACQMCEGDFCNTAKVGGAATMVISLTVLIMGVFINLYM